MSVINVHLTIYVRAYSSVRVWDVHKGKLVHTLTGHSEDIEVNRFKEV